MTQDNELPRHFRLLTEAMVWQVIPARDSFFRYITTTESHRIYGPEQENFDESIDCRTSLWSLFSAWLNTVVEDLYTSIFVDPQQADRMCEEFLNIVPTIYVLIIDKYLKDPSSLYFIERDLDTGEEIRTACHIASVAPLLDDTDLHHSDGSDRSAKNRYGQVDFTGREVDRDDYLTVLKLIRGANQPAPHETTATWPFLNYQPVTAEYAQRVDDAYPADY